MKDATVGRAQELVSIARRVIYYEEALTKASGEGFNIFNVLRVGHYEVRTHSPILAELLNPAGSHGQGAVFLKHFCAELGIEDFDPESARVDVEKHVGPQTAEDGGRMDILIHDKERRHIIVENKIYAAEQPNQLARYNKFARRAHLIFLTLFGEASQQSVVGLPVKNVSYRSQILSWLERCRKEVATVPTVRETITQYIHLVQQLTHQNTNSRMSQELTKTVLQDKPSYLSYKVLCKAERHIQGTILAKLGTELASPSLGDALELNFPSSGMADANGGFYFASRTMTEGGVRISFQFGQRELRGCKFGFSRWKEGGACPAEERLSVAFRDAFPGAPNLKHQNPWWVAFASWNQHLNWDDTTMAEIQFGTFHEEVYEIVRKLIGIFDEATQPLRPEREPS